MGSLVEQLQEPAMHYPHRGAAEDFSEEDMLFGSVPQVLFAAMRMPQAHVKCWRQHHHLLVDPWLRTLLCADSPVLLQLDSEHSQSTVVHGQPQQQQRQHGASGTATPAERGLDEDDELMGMSPETSNPRQQQPWGAKQGQQQAPDLQGWPQLGTPQQIHHHQQLRQRPQQQAAGQQQTQQLQQTHSTVGFEQPGLPALRTSWSSHTPSRMINQS